MPSKTIVSGTIGSLPLNHDYGREDTVYIALPAVHILKRARCYHCQRSSNGKRVCEKHGPYLGGPWLTHASPLLRNTDYKLISIKNISMGKLHDQTSSPFPTQTNTVDPSFRRKIYAVSNQQPFNKQGSNYMTPTQTMHCKGEIP